MPWIRTIGLDEATGYLKQQLEAAIKRAGRIWHIVGIMSLNPRVLRTSMDFYAAVMYGRSPLSRGQRELIAVVVSRVNHCRY
ncbi:MAG: carboxymuconolactone decarboxylase family protein [Gemmatimonadales bacterium]